jgi:CheY-like chemotaxis protein
VEATSKRSDNGTLAGVRVLVVEDEPMVRMLVDEMLHDLGCAVAGTASRLEEALDLARGDDFDVVILDVNLAGRRAWPVAEVLRARGRPFVIASGYRLSDMPADLNGIPVLGKPFVTEQLARMLTVALGRG